MTFKNWKKRSSLFVGAWSGNEHLCGRIERACAAAYKAGAQSQRRCDKDEHPKGGRSAHDSPNEPETDPEELED